jgi:hypothetical protein
MWSFYLWLFHQYPICIPLLPVRATCPAHLILFDLTILIMLDEECNLWSFSIRSYLQPPVNSSYLGTNMVFSLAPSC